VPRPAATLVRDRTTWLIYAQLGVWAYFRYGFGPVVPLLRDEQHTSRTVAGLHGTAFAVGGMVAGAALPWVIRRVGRHVLIWAGMIGLCASVLGLSQAHTLPATLACAVLAALSGSAAVNGIVAALSDHHGPASPASISEANALAAAAGLVAPLVVGACVAAGLGWRPGLAALAGVVVLLAVVALAFRVRVPAAAPVSVVDGRSAGRLPQLFWLVFVSLIATGSVEASMNLWVSDVLRTHARVPAGIATAALSAMIGGIVVGRLIGGRLVLRFAVPRVLLAALALAAAGFAIFWLAAVPWLALAGLVVCGLGISMHYPLGMALAVTHSGGQPDLAAARTSYALGLAFGVAPFALGAVADSTGPHKAFLLLPAFLAVSATAIAILSRSKSGSGNDDGGGSGLAPAVFGERDLVNSTMARASEESPGSRTRPPVPQRGDLDAEAAQQVSQERQREPDHGARIALDPLDERAAQPVDRERAGHL
jgi:predicted MFS family arabinose efflux permease